MATEAGLSIKDRLAMLQANNKNPQLSGPMKTASAVAHKTVTPVNKAPSASPQTDGPRGNAQDKDGAQLVFKLKSTGAPPPDGRSVTPLVPNKSKLSDTSAGGGAGVTSAKTTTQLGTPAGTSSVAPTPKDFQHPTPLVPKKPVGASHETVTMRDKSESENSPRPPSIQERLAALKVKAGDGSAEIKSSSPRSPTSPSQTKFHVFPQKAGPTVGQGVVPVKPTDLAKSIHQAAERMRAGKKVSDVFLRHSDGKRFRKVDLASVVPSQSFPPPPKPAAIDDVDLTTFLQAYATAKGDKLKEDAAKSGQAEAVDGDMDELYVEAESTSVQLRVRGKGSVKMASSVRVSEIPEFTEEEEEKETSGGQLGKALTANIPEAPEDEYDDCASAAAALVTEQSPQQPELEDPDEIYEPLDEDMPPPPPEPLPSPEPADDKKAKKEKEKEKEGKGAKKKDKAKEEVSKKEEKERKKKEEEIKKQRTKFGLKETHEKVGEGVVKNNASAGVFTKDLAVGRGEIVTILRMDNNPAGKWLVQNDQGKLGFVSSSNIEVATPSIRQMMSGTLADHSKQEDGSPEEVYEAVAEDMDEIYEEL